MAANDNRINIVEMEIAKGERDDVLEKYPPSGRKQMRDKSRSKLSTKIVKSDIPRVFATSASVRIMELSQPTKLLALDTLKKKWTILPPAFVDNLIKIVEAQACLTPEEASRADRRKKRRMRKLKPLEKRMDQITEDTTYATTLDRDATMLQFLITERFVRSIFEHPREMREGVPEIADVIMRRLTSLDEYADAKNGDRTTEQLRLLADVIARWIAEILDEVAETNTEALKKYQQKRQRERYRETQQVDEVKQVDKVEQVDEVEQVDKIEQVDKYNKTENLEQMAQMEEKQEENNELK